MKVLTTNYTVRYSHGTVVDHRSFVNFDGIFIVALGVKLLLNESALAVCSLTDQACSSHVILPAVLLSNLTRLAVLRLLQSYKPSNSSRVCVLR